MSVHWATFTVQPFSLELSSCNWIHTLVRKWVYSGDGLWLLKKPLRCQQISRRIHSTFPPRLDPLNECRRCQATPCSVGKCSCLCAVDKSSDNYSVYEILTSGERQPEVFFCFALIITHWYSKSSYPTKQALLGRFSEFLTQRARHARWGKKEKITPVETLLIALFLPQGHPQQTTNQKMC